MPYDAFRHQRRTIRLGGYDYARAGAYYVTICTHGRELLFGEVAGGCMLLNSYGEIAAEEWQRSAQIRREIEIDAFVVMPNHIHGIVIILDDEDVGTSGARPGGCVDRRGTGRRPWTGRPPATRRPDGGTCITRSDGG